MWQSEPIDDDELEPAADDEPELAVDDESDVEAHGGWGGAAAPSP
jgi:hypothetical protein